MSKTVAKSGENFLSTGSIHRIDKCLSTENASRLWHFFKVPKNDFSNLVPSVEVCVLSSSNVITVDIELAVPGLRDNLKESVCSRFYISAWR